MAGLKNVKTQAEDQRQLLYTMELNLATKKATVLSLKAELEKAKAEAQVPKDAAQTTGTAAYEQGMLETEHRLAEEVSKVCRDYCTMTWNEALKSVGVLADSELRRADRVFFPEPIREILTDLSSIALPLPPPEHVPSTQDLAANVGTSAGAGIGKEGLPSTSGTSSEDTLTIKDVISQAKEAKKPKSGDARSKAATTKEDPHPKKK